MSFSIADIMGNSLAKAAAIDFGIQWACWAVAAALKTEKFYDLAGSSTYLLLTALSFKNLRNPDLRQKVNSGMVAAWATRLGLFLFTRVMKDGGDSRFNVVKHRPGTFWIYWTLQGVWVFSTLLPTLIMNSKPETERVPIQTRDYVGWSMWAIGMFFEAVSDFQKSQFKANPANAGKFINTGLWSISRHPNYFGEIMMWAGLYVSSTSVLRGWEHIGVISPLLVTYLLTSLSGIPLLERAAQKRWGHDVDYQAYKESTAKLIPFIW